MADEKKPFALPDKWRHYLSELRSSTRSEKGVISTLSRFQKYTKDDIISYLENPINYEKALRDASIYMYSNSMHYKNLIDFHALMPTWAYTITPLKFDKQTANADALYKQYLKVMQKVQIMNLSHEMISVFKTCFREDVYYGVIYENKDSFFLQKLNPDYCRISAIVDGVYVYQFQFSVLTEESVLEYPEFFQQMFSAYQRDKTLEWQEIPVEYSICIKANQDLLYAVPPFAASMPLLYDIESYKDLIQERDEIANYKGINLLIPTGEKGEPLMDMDTAFDYYRLICDVVPPGVAVMMSPMKTTDFEFQKTGLTDTDEVAQVEQRFWSTTGTSPLLFGAGNKDSVTALKYSIKANEQIVLALMRQVERWVNRRLKQVSGSLKFRMNILPVTHFNVEEKVAQYKEACTYGIPAKSEYAVLQDMDFFDISANTFMENEIFQYPQTFIPLSSSYTQTGEEEVDTTDEGGRPTNESKNEPLTEAGEQTQRDDENAART